MATTSSPTAVIFIGNTGVGKSTLLSQLCEEFQSDATKGGARDIVEHTVTLNDREVILIDTPGLFEDDENDSKANAAILTEVLKKGYNYKLFFVLKAESTGLSPKDLAVMSTVNKCIRRSNGARVEFRVILNQIQDDKVYKMYQDQIAKDNFRKLFSSSKLRQFKFDIHIRSVMLVRFDEAAVADQLLKDDLVKEIEAQAESPIKVERDIKVEKNELEILSSMVLSIFADLAVDVVKDVLTEVLTDVATEVANQFLSNLF